MTFAAAVLTAIAYTILGLALIQLCRVRQAALLGPLRWAVLAAAIVTGLLATADVLLRLTGDSTLAHLLGALAAGGQCGTALLLFAFLRNVERRFAVIAGRRIRRRAALANAQADVAYALLALAGRCLQFGHFRLAADDTLGGSDEMFEILGLDPNATRSATPNLARALACYHQDDRATLQQHLRGAQETGAAFALELRVCRPRGELRQVALHGAGAGAGAVAGVLIDVTDQHMAAAKLRASEAAARQARAGDTCDKLTGLPNRQAFEASLTAEVKRALRANRSLALILLDFDRLGHFNRVYARAFGDTCLRDIAGAISALPRRAGDVLARHGGGTFAVLLPLCDADGASRVAESLRAAVQALAIPHAGSDPAIVTFSAGIAIIPGAKDPHAASEFCRRAQAALVAAQRKGGDGIHIHEAPPPAYRPVIMHEMGNQPPPEPPGAPLSSSAARP